MVHWYRHFICLLPPWRGAYRGVLVPAARAKALCVRESITFQPCKGLQQMSALQHCGIPLSFAHTLILPLRFCLGILSRCPHLIATSTVVLKHGETRRLWYKEYNKQRKLETRQTSGVTANMERHASQEGLYVHQGEWKMEMYTTENSQPEVRS